MGYLDSLELAVYDWGVRGSERTVSDRVAVVAIDDKSIQNLGRWPWPRDLHAEIYKTLSDAGPKVIGSTIFYTEEQIDPGFEAVNQIELMSKSSIGAAVLAATSSARYSLKRRRTAKPTRFSQVRRSQGSSDGTSIRWSKCWRSSGRA